MAKRGTIGDFSPLRLQRMIERTVGETGVITDITASGDLTLSAGDYIVLEADLSSSSDLNLYSGDDINLIADVMSMSGTLISLSGSDINALCGGFTIQGEPDGAGAKLYLYADQGDDGTDKATVSKGDTGGVLKFHNYGGVEVENPGASGKTAFLVDNDDTDEIALQITAANIDARVLDIVADSVTTANVVNINCDARTTGTGFRIYDGATNDSAGQLALITQGGDRAGSAASKGLEINFNTTANANARALYIDSEQTTGVVAEFDATEITTGKGLSIAADALTTGNALYVSDNSSNTGTRNTAHIVQDHASAIAATALAVQSDGGVTGVNLDKNYSNTTEASITGLLIDFDKTGASTSDNNMYGIYLDMDNTTATNGNNYMYGLYVTPRLTHAADAGGAFVYGALINAQGGTNGSSFVQGARIEAAGGDVNFGLQLDVEDGGVDLRIESSADNGDYFQIQTTTHGATTITTVDDNATAADLTFDIDGDMVIKDDIKLNFGDGKDWSIEYDENGTDHLIMSGNILDVRPKDHMVLGSGSTVPPLLYFKDNNTYIGSPKSGKMALSSSGDLIISSADHIHLSGTQPTITGSGDILVTPKNDLIVSGGLKVSRGRFLLNGELGSRIMFSDSGEYIYSDGGDLIIASGDDIRFNATNSRLFFAAGTGDVTTIYNGSAANGYLLWRDGEDRFEFQDDVTIASDEKLAFGDYNNEKAYMEYDEDGTDHLILSASVLDIRAADHIVIGSGSAGGAGLMGNATAGKAAGIFLKNHHVGMYTGLASGADSLNLSASNGVYLRGGPTGVKLTDSDMRFSDARKLFFGSGEDWSIKYDEAGIDSLIMSGNSLTVQASNHATFQSTETYFSGSIQAVGPLGTGEPSGYDPAVAGPITAFDSITDMGTQSSQGDAIAMIADGQGGGEMIRLGNFGDSGIVKGNVVSLYRQGWYLADPSDTENANDSTRMLAVALDDDGGDDEGLVLLRGVVRIASSLLTNYGGVGDVGDPIYLATTAGKYDMHPTTTSGDVVRIVGYLIDTDGTDFLIYFNPDKTFVTLA